MSRIFILVHGTWEPSEPMTTRWCRLNVIQPLKWEPKNAVLRPVDIDGLLSELKQAVNDAPVWP